MTQTEEKQTAPAQILPPTIMSASTFAAPATAAAAALAAHAKASVEARYAMALHRPRDLDVARERLLKECRRPLFAKAARFKKPIGGGKFIYGPSIRFAESAILALTNIHNETIAVSDDETARVLRIMVTDLEANATYARDVTILKQVERKGNLPAWRKSLGQRLNSSGELVHIVESTEDELQIKEAAIQSKILRTAALRLVPKWLIDEAMEVAIKTQENEAARDPDATRKELLDGFARLRVTAADLRAYIGHDLAQLTPAEIQDLIEIGVSIKEEDTTWAEVMATRENERKEEAAAKKRAEGPAPPTVGDAEPFKKQKEATK